MDVTGYWQSWCPKTTKVDFFCCFLHRPELVAQAACVRKSWFHTVDVVGQHRALIKEQLSQWTVYREGLKRLRKLLGEVDPLLPPAGPLFCTLHQEPSCYQVGRQTCWYQSSDQLFTKVSSYFSPRRMVEFHENENSNQQTLCFPFSCQVCRRCSQRALRLVLPDTRSWQTSMWNHDRAGVSEQTAVRAPGCRGGLGAQHLSAGAETRPAPHLCSGSSQTSTNDQLELFCYVQTNFWGEKNMGCHIFEKWTTNICKYIQICISWSELDRVGQEGENLECCNTLQ